MMRLFLVKITKIYSNYIHEEKIFYSWKKKK